mgnify:CR=1 FL=1
MSKGGGQTVTNIQALPLMQIITRLMLRFLALMRMTHRLLLAIARLS